MSTMTAARPKIKPTRRTARPAASFGAGILRFAPFAVTYPDHFEPSAEDRAAAAAMFAADADADADWDARMAADANGDRCEVCGRPVERGELLGGLCNVCQCRAEEATMASLYYSAGMGWRSY
jgi:hypothetical protein